MIVFFIGFYRIVIIYIVYLDSDFGYLGFKLEERGKKFNFGMNVFEILYF